VGVELNLKHLSEAGKALFERGKPEMALDFFALAAELAPGDPVCVAAHASALRVVNRPAEAEEVVRRAIAIEPNPQRLTILACAIRDRAEVKGLPRPEQHRIKDEAEAVMRQALELDPLFSDAVGLLGIWLLDKWHRADSPDETLYYALTHINHAIALAPENLHFKAMRLAALQARDGFGMIVEEATELIEKHPGCCEFHMHRGASNLALGNHRDGWPELAEWAYKLSRFKDFPLEAFPRWWPNQLEAAKACPTGTDVLVWNPEGAGDYFMFARYFARLAREGWRVKPISNNTMDRLLRLCPGVVETVAPESKVVDQYLTPIMTLPAAYTLYEEEIPWEGPYLGAHHATIDKWSRLLVKRLNVSQMSNTLVGIAWRGNPQQGNDQRRSFDVRRFAPLFDVPGVTLVSIQKGGSADIEGLPIIDLGEAFEQGDWLDTAGVIANLDLAIAPCTGVAHLAGAMGKPTWLALSEPACWRWGRGRDDTPWYPTMRIFRQRERGLWEGLFERMAGELAKLSRAAA
jgi:tetratricopeptide (TPR) repeat protein